MVVPAAMIALPALFFIGVGLHSFVTAIKKKLSRSREEIVDDVRRMLIPLGLVEDDDTDTQPIYLYPIQETIETLELKKESDRLLKIESPAETFTRLQKMRKQNA